MTQIETSSSVPATKPQPVVVYGAAIAAATSLVGGLTVLLKDNPTAVLVLGIASVVVGAAAVFKDQVVKGQVVPLQDSVAYVNDQREVVTGPAAPNGEGQLVKQLGTQVTPPTTWGPGTYRGTYGTSDEPTEDPNDLGRGVAGN